MNVKLTSDTVLDIIKRPAVHRVSSSLKRIYFSIKNNKVKTCCGQAENNVKVKTAVNQARNIILNMSTEDKKRLKHILGMEPNEHFIA